MIGRVGIQGDAGSFSDAALRTLGDRPGRVEHFADFASLLAALDRGELDRALLPVHNTLAGVVAASLEAIAAHDVRVEAETELGVHLCLAAPPGSSIARLSSAASHPVALRQCSRFFAHHPWIEPHAEYDTAGAARLVAEARDPAAAAIASREAAERHGLVVLAEDIQDRRDNVTRFWLVARRRLAGAAATGTSPIDAHLALHLGGGRAVRAIRGATTLPDDTPGALREATHELLGTIAAVNGIGPADVISAIFTVTPDITSDFPALAAREAGWERVPLLCAAEIPVPGALARCLRVLLHVAHDRGSAVRHVYLRDARALRADLLQQDAS